MGDDTIETFTKLMTSEKVFACAVCENLLSPPVMIVENIGNVCLQCFDDETQRKEWHGVPNAKLDIILKACKFPCKFETEGCIVVSKYDNLKKHEEQCLYQLINCLFTKEDCQWRGSVVDLFKHFKEEHPKHVLNSPYEELSFELNIAKPTNVIKLLNHKNKIDIFRVKETEGKKYLLHFIQEIKSGNDDVAMVVKYVGKEDQHKVSVKRLPLFAPCDETNGKKICLSTLKEIADSDGNVRVIAKPRKHEPKNITTEILKELECAVCKELMRPPISLCMTGHSFCNACRKRLGECPTCRTGWGNSRNFALESLTRFVQYPCDYTQYGCTASFLGDEVCKHEGICEYQMCKCPISNCNFTGNYLSCKNHFCLNHKDKLLEGTNYEGRFTLLPSRSPDSTEIQYFFEHGNIYKFMFSRTIDFCKWGIQILNTFDHRVKYYFKITIIHPLMQQEQLAKSKLCVDKVANLSDQNLISFTNENLLIFKNRSNNDLINYRCELFEEKSTENKIGDGEKVIADPQSLLHSFHTFGSFHQFS